MFPAHTSHPAFPLSACPPRPRKAACYGAQLDCNLEDPKQDLPACRTGCSSPRAKELCFCSGAQVFKYQNTARDPEQSLCRFFPVRAVTKCRCLNELLQPRVHCPSGQEPVAISWTSSSHFTTENMQGMPQTQYGIARAFIVPLDHTPGFGKNLALLRWERVSAFFALEGDTPMCNPSYGWRFNIPLPERWGNWLLSLVYSCLADGDAYQLFLKCGISSDNLENMPWRNALFCFALKLPCSCLQFHMSSTRAQQPDRHIGPQAQNLLPVSLCTAACPCGSQRKPVLPCRSCSSWSCLSSKWPAKGSFMSCLLLRCFAR